MQGPFESRFMYGLKKELIKKKVPKDQRICNGHAYTCTTEFAFVSQMTSNHYLYWRAILNSSRFWNEQVFAIFPSAIIIIKVILCFAFICSLTYPFLVQSFIRCFTHTFQQFLFFSSLKMPSGINWVEVIIVDWGLHFWYWGPWIKCPIGLPNGNIWLFVVVRNRVTYHPKDEFFLGPVCFKIFIL